MQDAPARRLRHASLLWGALLVLLINLATLPVKAVEPDEVLQDQALEARARHISEGLRCLVCQNQSIDDFERAARQGPPRAGAGTAQGRRYRPRDRGLCRRPLRRVRAAEAPLYAPHAALVVRHARGVPRRPPDRRSGVSAGGPLPHHLPPGSARPRSASSRACSTTANCRRPARSPYKLPGPVDRAASGLQKAANLTEI